MYWFVYVRFEENCGWPVMMAQPAIESNKQAETVHFFFRWCHRRHCRHHLLRLHHRWHSPILIFISAVAAVGGYRARNTHKSQRTRPSIASFFNASVKYVMLRVCVCEWIQDVVVSGIINSKFLSHQKFRHSIPTLSVYAVPCFTENRTTNFSVSEFNISLSLFFSFVRINV